MKKRTKVAMVGAFALAAGGAGVATATGAVGDNSSHAITGKALERASDAALKATGGGQVTETEVGDEESYYQVEVTLDDGSHVDVQLDEHFNVVGSSVDHEEDGDDG